MWDVFGVYVAGRYFHTELDFKALTLLDLPALVVAGGVDALLASVGIRLSRVADTYVVAVLWFTFGSLQWWLLGALIAGWRPNKRLQPAASAVSSR